MRELAASDEIEKQQQPDENQHEKSIDCHVPVVRNELYSSCEDCTKLKKKIVSIQKTCSKLRREIISLVRTENEHEISFLVLN